MYWMYSPCVLLYIIINIFLKIIAEFKLKKLQLNCTKYIVNSEEYSTLGTLVKL